MKRFLLKISVFLIIILIIDCTIGYSFDRAVKGIKIGGVGRENYIANELHDDIIILGSSRAHHHYNAQIMTDSLGITCYNAGEGSWGSLYSYTRLVMIEKRYLPQMIIREVTPNLDYLSNGDNKESLFRIKKFYEITGIDSIFWEVDKNNRWKMLSGMYRHNSSFMRNMFVFLSGYAAYPGIRGFKPYDELFDTMKVNKDGLLMFDRNKGFEVDSFKLGYFNRFLDRASKSRLILVVSPVWYGMDTLVLDPIKDYCKKQNICLIDFSNDIKYVHNDSFFRDGYHLNAVGADEFTRDFVKKLKTVDAFINIKQSPK